MQALILNTKRNTFVNENDNRRVAYSKTTLAIPDKQTENSVGYDVVQVTGQIEEFDVIKQYIGKSVEIEVSYQKADNNTYKMKLKKIADIEL